MMIRYLDGIFWQRDLKIWEGLLSLEKYSFFNQHRKLFIIVLDSGKPAKRKEQVGTGCVSNQYGPLKKLAVFGQ